jgi:hypothetical protein
MAYRYKVLDNPLYLAYIVIQFLVLCIYLCSPCIDACIIHSLVKYLWNTPN